MSLISAASDRPLETTVSAHARCSRSRLLSRSTSDSPDDRVERCPDLVAHGGEEKRLRLVGRFGVRPGLAERAHQQAHPRHDEREEHHRDDPDHRQVPVLVAEALDHHDRGCDQHHRAEKQQAGQVVVGARAVVEGEVRRAERLCRWG